MLQQEAEIFVLKAGQQMAKKKKKTDVWGWKNGNTGVIVAKNLVKTVVCDYLDAPGELGKFCKCYNVLVMLVMLVMC